MVMPLPPPEFYQDEPSALGRRGSPPVGVPGDLMGGMVPPPPMAMQPDAILDPMQMMQELMDRGLAEDLAPKYPSWLYQWKTQTDPITGVERSFKELSPPRMPSDLEFEDWIANDVLLHGALMMRFQQDLRMYRGMKVGVWQNYNPDRDAFYQSSEPIIQVNKIMAMLNGSIARIRYPSRTHKEREMAARMEAFAYWLMDQVELHHRLSGHQEFRLDLGFYGLVFGRQVVQVMPDLTDGDFPWWISAIDPATCFPIYGHGKRGLIRMTRRYEATLYDVVDEFASTEKEAASLLKKLGHKRDMKTRKDVDGNESLDLTQDVTVDECHTRWHRYVSVGGVKLEKVAHELGEVPFVYNLAIGEGETSGVTTTGRDEGLTREDILRGWGFEGFTSAQREMATRGQSFFQPIKKALMQKERVLTLSMIALEQTVNPATVTNTPYPNNPPPPPDLGPGGNNTRRVGETTNPVVPSPRPMDTEAVMRDVNSELSKGMLPEQVFGVSDASNVTGFASESQIAAAVDRIGPYFTLTQNTIADTIDKATRTFRNHGHLADGLEDGRLIVPSINRTYGPLGMKQADMPEWGRDVMMAIFNQIMQPGGGLGPALPAGPATPPPGGGGPAMSPLAGASAAPPAALGMGQGGPMPSPAGGGGWQALVGVPGFVHPQWTLPPSGINEDVPLVYIDRATIDAIGTRPKVTLSNLSLNNKTTLVNYLTQAVNGKFMDRATAIEELPENDNAYETFQRILAEEGMTNPDMLQAIYYPRSLAAMGDADAWASYMAIILGPKIREALMMNAQLGMAPPASGAPAQNGGGQAPIKQPANGPVSGRTVSGGAPGPGANGEPVGRPA